MNSILNILILCLIFTGVILCEGATAKEYSLWEVDGNTITGSLPDGWVPMLPEELQKFSEKSTGLFQLPGDLVAGFRLHNAASVTATPYIVVFINDGERVPQDQIQKTYSWFQKNTDVVSGLLPSNIKRVTIEDIENRQKEFSILFQVRIEAENDIFTNVVFCFNF